MPLMQLSGPPKRHGVGAHGGGVVQGVFRAWGDRITMALVVGLSLLTLYEVHMRSVGYERGRRPDVRSGQDDYGGNFNQKNKNLCRIEAHTEYDAPVITGGDGGANRQRSLDACCMLCAINPACNVWVWCASPAGCAGHHFGECWLKQSTLQDVMKQEGFSHPQIGWTSGSIFDPAVRAGIEVPEAKRLKALRANKALPLVYLDLAIQGESVGRVEIILFTDVAPIASENFRAMCTGERGIVPAGQRGAGRAYSFKGAPFYSIQDRSMIVAGTNTSSIYGGTFADETKGLALKHDRRGLLTTESDAIDSNNGDFGIILVPLPDRDGDFVVFGEVVSGIKAAMRVAQLARGKGTVGAWAGAIIQDAGQLR